MVGMIGFVGMGCGAVGVWFVEVLSGPATPVSEAIAWGGMGFIFVGATALLGSALAVLILAGNHWISNRRAAAGLGP